MITCRQGSQRAPAGRLVPALPGAELQPDLPQVPQSPQDLPPGEPGLAQRPQMAPNLVRSGTRKLDNDLRNVLHVQQVSEGLRLLPEDADGAGAVADGGAQEEPEEARQDQLNLVHILERGLGLSLLLILLILGREQVPEGRQRLRQVLRRRARTAGHIAT